MSIRVANLLANHQASHQACRQAGHQASLQLSQVRSLLHNQQISRLLNPHRRQRRFPVVSRLVFHLRNRPLFQLQAHLRNPVRSLVPSQRSHRQSRHLASLLLLHHANQLLNLVASLLHNLPYLRVRSRQVNLLDNHQVNLLVNLHHQQGSLVVNLPDSQLRSQQRRFLQANLHQYLLVSLVVRPQDNLP